MFRRPPGSNRPDPPFPYTTLFRSAVSQADALIDAGDDLMSNRFVLGDHHFTLAVYADSVKGLRDHMSVARAALADTGMVAAREGAALEAAYWRSEEHTSELQSLMRISYAVFCLKITKTKTHI